MKKVYEKPLIEIEEFEVHDIITLSEVDANTEADFGEIK